MSKNWRRRDHVLILRGKRGERILEKIMDGPKVPYEKLRKRADEAMEKILDDRGDGGK